MTVINQRVIIHALLIWRNVTPPHHRAATSQTDRGLVFQTMCCLCRGTRGQSMIPPGIKRLRYRTFNRPTFFPAPMPRNFINPRPGRVPVAHIHRKTRLIQNAGIDALQPLVEPAHSLVPPFHLRCRPGIVWVIVIPRPNHRFDWSFDMFEHPRR